MHFWKPYFYCTLLAAAPHAGSSDLHYKVNKTEFSESADRLTIHVSPPITVKIQPGLVFWPPVVLDEWGRIYAGDAVVDSITATTFPIAAPGNVEPTVRYPNNLNLSVKGIHFLFQQNARKCAFTTKNLGLGLAKPPLDFFQDGNLRIATSNTKILALAVKFSPEGDVDGFQVDSIDMRSCKVTPTQLGNPDLLVEIGFSALGGWWITGSIEQTLLRSIDGKHWIKVKLPDELISLVSSYIVNDNEIWLAAILPESLNQGASEFVYSANNGKTWTVPMAGDRLMDSLPPAWLEGHRRTALRSVNELETPGSQP